jgi:hypothetical protein
MPSQAMEDLIDAFSDRTATGCSSFYQLMSGAPEAAKATEQIGKFLRARVR